MKEKMDIIYSFGEDVIVKARDMSISDGFEIVDGVSNAPSDVALSHSIENLTTDQKHALKKLIVHCVDGAINNFLWMMEENNDKYAFVAKTQNDETFDIEKESDGLCLGQYEFIDQYSRYNNILDILATGKLEKE